MGLGFKAGEHKVNLNQLLLDYSLGTSIIKGLDAYRKISIVRLFWIQVDSILYLGLLGKLGL